MKNLDRLFIVLLIVVPLISAVVLAITLTQRKNITPDDSSAATPTPVYVILPVSPTDQALPTTTYAQGNPTQLPTSKPTASPTSKPTTTPTAPDVVVTTTAEVTLGPTLSVTPTASSMLTPTVTDTNLPAFDTSSILLTVLIVAFTFGGLVAFGSMLRKSK